MAPKFASEILVGAPNFASKLDVRFKPPPTSLFGSTSLGLIRKLSLTAHVFKDSIFNEDIFIGGRINLLFQKWLHFNFAHLLPAKIIILYDDITADVSN